MNTDTNSIVVDSYSYLHEGGNFGTKIVEFVVKNFRNISILLVIVVILYLVFYFKSYFTSSFDKLSNMFSSSDNEDVDVTEENEEN